MADDLILQAVKLMREQAGAYARLRESCDALAAALVQSSPESVASLTSAGESELLRMRSRLVQLMAVLTAFATARSKSTTDTAIRDETRRAFEEASSVLAAAARDFQRMRERAGALAHSGSSLVSATIETCGFKPTTYRAPYTRQGERAWA